jgi:sugar-specific transcriptional regulator TrmB
MEPVTALSALGFTELESRIYCELLRQSPLTGYRLSQLVAKAPANTYQALKTLSQKGGVIVSEGAGDAKTYAAVPAEELMASLAQNFDERREAALDCLRGLQRPASEEHVYQLQSVSQVLERARAMFAAAQEIVLFDFFPGIYELMESSILAARERGVLVAGIVYDAAHASPNTPFNGEAATVVANLWPGLGLIVVADGEQKLIAQISKDQQTLLNGVWSDSIFLSATYHSALAAEIRLTAMRLDPSDPLRHIALFQSRPPGLREVLARTKS